MIIDTPSASEIMDFIHQHELTRSDFAQISGYSYNTLCQIMREEPGYTFCPVRFGIIKYVITQCEEYLQDSVETFVKIKKMKITFE